MARTQDWLEGGRAASGSVQRQLHGETDSINNPEARQMVHSMRFQSGVILKRNWQALSSDPVFRNSNA
jgi:riboflavin biosynthesis pyrimidine reductase